MTILFIVAKKKGMTQSALAKALQLEKSTVSRNMQRLFDNDYVSKSEDSQIRVTENGKDLLELIIPEWKKATAEARAMLSTEGEDAIQLILSKLGE